jgi:FkbM family methyltransferase
MNDNFQVIRRLPMLVRRSFAAARLGFLFYGTSKSNFPTAVRLSGRRKILSAPQNEGGLLSDVINIWLDDEYGLGATESVPKSIIDVGANIGLFSLYARHRFPNATIHAYEPNPRIHPFLEANLDGTSISVFRSGLGAKEGWAELDDKIESRLASTRSSDRGKIKINALAEAVQRLDRPDLIKIDCEGAEWDLFEDIDSLRRVREIRMEYHLVQGRCLQDFKSKVSEIGFAISRLAPNQGFGIAWLRRRNS